MIWISITCFLIAFLICCSMLKREADIMSPARVFGFTWSIVFGLANLKFSGFQSEWTFGQWAYALLGPTSFILGLVAAYVVSIGAQLHPINGMRQMVKHQKIDDEKLFYIIILAFVTYLVGYFVTYLVKGYIPIFAPNPSAARIEYFIFGIGLFIHHMPIVVILSLVYHLVARDNHSKKRVLKILVFISILTYLFLLQRYQLIMISMMVFTLLYYTTRYIRFRTMILFVILGIFVIYSIASLRVGQLVQTVLYTTSQMKFSYQYAIFTEPYMYMVMNIENFVHAVSRLDQHTYGYYTFDFALAVTGLKYPIKEYFGLVDTPYLTSGYNAYSIFWTYYRDFGLLGISLVPLIGGLFIGSVYYAMRRNPTIELVSFYSVMVFVMGLSFFLSPLGFLWFVYIVAWMGMTFRLVCTEIRTKQ